MEVDAEATLASEWQLRAASRLVRAFWLRHRRGGPWEVPARIVHEEIAFSGNLGARLSGRWFPAKDARGAVVLVHPDRRYGQHWFVLEGWIEVLHDHAYNVLTFDFPDYGESEGGGTYYPLDVVAAARFAKTRSPSLPLHVVGLSMGAFAAATASRWIEGLGALVLDAPYPSYNEWFGRRLSRLVMVLFDLAFPRIKPLLRADVQIQLSRASYILVLASRDDKVTPPGLSKKVASAAPPGRTRWLELAGFGHLEGFGSSRQYREAILEALGKGGVAGTGTTR